MQCLSALLGLQPYCHTNATPHSLPREDQIVRDSRLPQVAGTVTSAKLWVFLATDLAISVGLASVSVGLASIWRRLAFV